MLTLAKKLAVAPDPYFDEDFRDLFENQLPLFKARASDQSVPVAAMDAELYKGRFYDYLYKVGILPQYHYFVMRVNDMLSPSDFGPGIGTLKTPNTTDVDRLLAQFNTVNTLKS